MKMIWLMIYLFSFLLLYADEYALTTDGKVILLQNDGTWKTTELAPSEAGFQTQSKKTNKGDENQDVVEIKNINTIQDKILIREFKSDSKMNFEKIKFTKKDKKRFTKLIFQTLNNEITITLIKLNYADGTEKKISENFTLYPDIPVKLLEIKKAGGSNEIVDLRIDFSAVLEVSAQTILQVYGVE